LEYRDSRDASGSGIQALIGILDCDAAYCEDGHADRRRGFAEKAESQGQPILSLRSGKKYRAKDSEIGALDFRPLHFIHRVTGNTD
jgi:hypothetical protein